MPTTYDIAARQGDTWDGASFTIRVNGVLKNLTGAVVVMLVSDNHGTLLSLEPIVTITNAVDGVFQVDPQILPLKRGVYSHTIRITFLDGSVKTWIFGRTRIA